MNGRKSPTPAIAQSLAKSIDFELTINDLTRRSERRAWTVAFSAIGMALILAGGYFYMLPLKQKVPYLVMADAYTGTATVAHLAGQFGPHGITANEAINRSNVAHFVLARESYDLATLTLGDWKTVQTMASSGVKAEYVAQYSSQNPDSLYKQLGKDRAIRVRLLSVVLLGGGHGRTPRGATVRFQRSVYDKATGVTRPLDNKIATIAFSYKPNLEMDDQSRIENPLGFWVDSYRVDNDYAAAPPPEIPGAPLTTPPADATPPVDSAAVAPRASGNASAASGASQP